MGEGGRVEVFCLYIALAYTIFKVLNVCTTFIPSLLCPSSFKFRVNCNFHPIVEHRITLRVILNVEFDWVISSRILHSEVKPLGVAFGIDIVLH